MVTAALILALVATDCPPLIEQELPERLGFCQGRRDQHKQDCMRRLRHTAKVWGCKMPEYVLAHVPEPELIDLRGSGSKSGGRPRT